MVLPGATKKRFTRRNAIKKKRIISLLLGLVMVLAAPPVTALAAASITSFRVNISAPSIGKKLHTNATNSSKLKVTNIEWSGETDSEGKAIYDVAYTVTFTVEIKEGEDARFSSKSLTATVNGRKESKVERISGTRALLSYTYPAVNLAERQEKQAAQEAEAEAAVDSRRLTMAEADEKRPLNQPITIVVNKGTVDTSRGSAANYVAATRNKLTTLDGQEILDVPTVDGSHSAAIFRIAGVCHKGGTL